MSFQTDINNDNTDYTGMIVKINNDIDMTGISWTEGKIKNKYFFRMFVKKYREKKLEAPFPRRIYFTEKNYMGQMS